MRYIGIDPGDTCGFALMVDGILQDVRSYTFWQLIDRLQAESFMLDLDKFTVVLEATYLNKPPWANKKTSKMVRNVGMNQQTAKLIRDWCKLEKIELIEVRPSPGRATKYKPDLFLRITGWKGSSSEHSRDAAMLIWGRK